MAKVAIYDQQSSFVIPPSQVEALILSSLETLNIRTDEVIVHLVEKPAICALHQEFFNDPSPTDCISFPIDTPHEQQEEPQILGEIFVCPQVALEYAEAHNRSPLDEIYLYIVHGLLHLLGYDDQTEEEEIEMRAQEKYLLEKFASAPF